jgi:hypothetical protein
MGNLSVLAGKLLQSVGLSWGRSDSWESLRSDVRVDLKGESLSRGLFLLLGDAK